MKFPSVDLVKTLQIVLIDEYGGHHGLRDQGLLESAIARAPQLMHYIPGSTVVELAATLAWGLIKNHAFDGNKRIGLAALTSMLEANGWTLSCSEEQETAAILKAASGDFTEQQWTAWLTAKVTPFTL